MGKHNYQSGNQIQAMPQILHLHKYKREIFIFFFTIFIDLILTVKKISRNIGNNSYLIEDKTNNVPKLFIRNLKLISRFYTV